MSIQTNQDSNQSRYLFLKQQIFSPDFSRITTTPGPCLNIKLSFPGMGISLLKIRRSRDHLSFNMGIPVLGKTGIFILRQPPGCDVNAKQPQCQTHRPCIRLSQNSGNQVGFIFCFTVVLHQVELPHKLRTPCGHFWKTVVPECGLIWNSMPICSCSFGFCAGWAVNSLWPGDAIWWHRSGSTLAQVMACCLTAPSHYLNQCGLIYHQQSLVAFIWGQFHKRYLSHHSLNLAWKLPS